MEVLSTIAPWVGAAAAMYLAVTGARELLSDYEAWVRMSLLIATGAVTYLCVAFALVRGRTLQVLAVVRSIVMERRAG